MKLLISGLRGVGKSTLREKLAVRLNIPSRSVGDFMQEYCSRVFPEIDREAMREKLTIDQQLIIAVDLAKEIARHDNLIIEGQSVISEDFGTMIPAQPIFRSIGLDGIILLISDPEQIKARRASDNKKRLQRFLDEPQEVLSRQQQLTETYFISFGVSMGIHTFIINNDNEVIDTVEAALKAIDIINIEKQFLQNLENSGVTTM